ncbi:thioredoxin [uncultured Clostridium sp.]|uniref:thioredoxin n=1 Tax=uncultured Clostridium sp. TaxID=59620 RepID=UPI0025D69CC0|nr:thioredoxin [uncultured Clostridium sp.]
MIKIVDDNNFTREVLMSTRLVIVDFFATWCGPCKMLSPILETISKENKNVKIVRIDVDDNPKASNRYDIRSIPKLIFFKNGKEVDEILGFVPKDIIKEVINDNL